MSGCRSCRKVDQKGKVMIQTYDPENLTLKQVIENDYEGSLI